MADAARFAQALARSEPGIGALSRAVAEILRAPFEASLDRVVEGAAPLVDAVAVPLSLPDGGLIVVELDEALAAAIVSALLRRPELVVVRFVGASPELSGAIAALLFAALRRIDRLGDIRANVSVAPPRAPHRSLLTALLRVQLGGAHYAARVGFDDASMELHRATAVGWNATALERLGAHALDVPVVATQNLGTREELASLAPGDAWICPAWPLRKDHRGGLAGPVLLASPLRERGVRGTLRGDGNLELTGPTGALPWEEDAAMDDTNETLHEALGDVPLVVRVEVGSVRLSAREWAALAPGDLVPLAIPIGAPIVLRIGGVEVARGELVDLEGETGVRILGRVEETQR